MLVGEKECKIFDIARERLKRSLERAIEDYYLGIDKMSPEALEAILDSLELNRIDVSEIKLEDL